MTNLNSTTELTEFAPLSPEPKPSTVTSFFSKIFTFSQVPSIEEGNSGLTLSNDCTAPAQSPITVDADRSSNMSTSDSIRYSSESSLVEGRNLPNVLYRVSSLLALRNKNCPRYKDTNLKQYWMPDSVSKECYECADKFTAFRRRHHCRVCGQIFCSQCCNQEVPGKIIGCSGYLRVCTYCCKVILSYLLSADIEADLSSDLKALQDDLKSKFGSDGITSLDESCLQDALLSNLANQSNSLSVDNKRKVSVVYQEEKFLAARHQYKSNAARESGRTDGVESETPLTKLVEEVVRGENRMTLQTVSGAAHLYEHCFLGCQLIDWLIARKKTSSRTHSLAICQVLLDANCIENVTEKSIDFVDGPVLYNFRLPLEKSIDEKCENEVEEDQHEQFTGLDSNCFSSEGNAETPSSNLVFRLDLNIQKNTAHISRHPQKLSSNVRDKRKHAGSGVSESLSDDILKNFLGHYGGRLGQLSPTNWTTASWTSGSDDDDEAAVYQALCEAFSQHAQNTVNQLLASENLSLSWSNVIVPLVESGLKEIKLDFSKTDIVDIRHYIKLKKMPGGDRKDSMLVKGIVFSKNVAHRDMINCLTNPRILLLQCAIVYQRVEGRLMSLEPVMMQEHDYLGNAVARIASLKPDLVIVHRNVSRLAQEALNLLGITLVLNVKLNVMERLARCTNADLLTSVDAHLGTVQLGTCQTFYTKQYTLADGTSKTLMFFEGCAFPQLGSTILLRGGASELGRVKKVTSAVAFMKHNAKSEKSFLMDEFAKPPTWPLFTLDPECDADLEQKPSDTWKCSTKSSTKSHDPVGKKCSADAEEKKYSLKSVVDRDDPLFHLQTNEDEDEVFGSEIQKEESQLFISEVPMHQNKFRAALRDTILSYSPFITFNLPYLETETGRRCELRKYFPTNIYFSIEPNNVSELSKTVNSDDLSFVRKIDINKKQADLHPFVLSKLTADIGDEYVQTMLALYRASGGRYESRAPDIRPEPTRSFVKRTQTSTVLDATNHQKIAVLFCSFSQCSNNAPDFCVSPWIVNMDFYGCNDIPLGCFLERYCFRKSYICPSSTCDSSMLDHERRFVHDTGSLHITLREIESLSSTFSGHESILMWSRCTICNLSTPAVVMSSESWNLSFAKYLELRFHATKYTCRARDDNRDCNHYLHQDFCQYFYHRNIVASFRYSKISLWEISLPPSILRIQHVPLEMPKLVEEVKTWAVMGHEVFSSILERLCRLDPDSGLPTIQGLKKQLSKQQAAFKQKVDDIQVIITSSTLAHQDNNNHIGEAELWKVEDSMVLLKKSVADALLNWNALLVKLDSRKKDDRIKNKSVSSDIRENISTASVVDLLEERKIDEIQSQRDGDKLGSVNSDEFVCSQVSLDDGCRRLAEKEYGENLQAKEDNDMERVSDTLSDSASNQLLSSSSSDKLTVKALLSQLLPNTFHSSASLLSNPINLDEHYLMNVSCSIPLVVYESEPSSIIAYALSTYHYQYSLDNIVKANSVPTTVNDQKNYSKRESLDGVPWLNTSNEGIAHEGEDTTDDSKSKSSKSESQHIEINFSDSSSNFTVKVYFAQQFTNLRSLVYPAGEDAYVRSLSRCFQWAAHGGKSGSSFCKTSDDRFILKEMSRLEIQPFIEFAPNYFQYVQHSYSNEQPTLLGKIMGVYKVKYRNAISNQNFQSNLLVMENLFYTRHIERKFDLKGSVRNRLVNPSTQQHNDLVLLDENLINMFCESPLYVFPHSKAVLIRAINNDVRFLAAHSVIDYSLLVGLDEQNRHLVVGIIDYIRTFTWDKKLETIVKKSGILGGQGKLPTIVSPEEYKNRFIAAMHKYFLDVPDQWLTFGNSLKY